MPQYSWVTTWRFQAPVEPVWNAIRNYKDWPSWWPSIQDTKQIAPGDADGVGEIVEVTWRTRLPYKVRFMTTITRIRPAAEIELRAVGELEGTGRWQFTPQGDETLVEYFWDVRTTQWWMNLLAPVARPAFTWNHDQVMETGRVGMVELLKRQQSPAPS